MKRISSHKKINIDDLSIEIIRSNQRKTLSLEIDHGLIKARAPLRMSETVIRSFIFKKKEWIYTHLKDMPATQAQLKMIQGEIIPFLNEDYTLILQECSKKTVRIVKNEIKVPFNKTHLSEQITIKNKLIKWYKKQAQSIISNKVNLYASSMNIESDVKAVKVREYKRRWGSCNHRQELSFNWRLIMAPEAVIDYVVVHELAHLVEFNHSKRFWLIVEHQLPQWRDQQQWLAENGKNLYRL